MARAQSRTKPIVVFYKDWYLVQEPWNSCYGKQYAKYIYNPDGKLAMRAGYAKHCTRKELKLILMNWAEKQMRQVK